jgi:hypothetical protein
MELELALDFHHFESFDEVTHFDVIELIDVKTAFVTGIHFFHIAFERPMY